MEGSRSDRDPPTTKMGYACVEVALCASSSQKLNLLLLGEHHRIHANQSTIPCVFCFVCGRRTGLTHLENYGMFDAPVGQVVAFLYE